MLAPLPLKGSERRTTGGDLRAEPGGFGAEAGAKPREIAAIIGELA